MASLAVLETALELLTSPDPESVRTDVFEPESLGAQEKTRLRTQVASRLAWGLGRKQNLMGVGISEKVDHGERTDELALTIYVKQKHTPSSLSASDTIPPQLELEGLGEPVPTDVREIGILRLEALTTRIRPVVGGYSIGRADKGFTGTLGCLVTKHGDPSKRFLLSNNHIFAKAGLGQPGDPIFQPGADDEQPQEALATLESWLPFKFTDFYDNRVDAALAEPVDPAVFDSDIFEIGTPKGITSAERGMMIQKSGRTTGHTWGRIEDITYRVTAPYPNLGRGYSWVKFTDLVLCSRCTAPGDSGSLILDADEKAVGLHFLGSETVSVFNKITNVQDELGIDLVV